MALSKIVGVGFRGHQRQAAERCHGLRRKFFGIKRLVAIGIRHAVGHQALKSNWRGSMKCEGTRLRSATAMFDAPG